jgi:para-nitrobenzyl esterase
MQFLPKIYERKEVTLMDKIKLDSGYISGILQGEPGREVRVYRGIPYAAPPVGDLRWQPPQPVTPWTGVRECAAFSIITPQCGGHIPGANPDKPDPRQALPQSEDCLYLNVLTPAKKSSDKLPVMVWMHGGGFIFGSGNEELSNLLRLPQHGVVQVNVNMRLGPLGLLAHRLLSRESPGGVSGNYMILDMIAALKWVQINIAAFGGDPGNVTIFGESGGGAKVVTLIASPLAKGLFHRAIAESGSPDGKPLAELEAMGDRFFARIGVDKAKDPLKAIRALPWQKIMAVESELVRELHAYGRGELWDVAVDGWLMPEIPLDIFKAGKQNRVPYMLVANLGELSTPPGVYLIPHYLAEFSGAVKTKVKAYACIFDQVPSLWKRDGCYSTHAMELGYVFGDWDNTSGFWPGLLEGIAGMAGARSPDPGLTDVDRKVSELMMRIWTHYAKNGDPDVEGLPDWPAWDKAGDKYLFLTAKPEIKSGYSRLPEK